PRKGERGYGVAHSKPVNTVTCHKEPLFFPIISTTSSLSSIWGQMTRTTYVCVACVVTSRRAPTSHRPTPVQGACTISCLYFTHGSSGGRSTFTCEKTVA